MASPFCQVVDGWESSFTYIIVLHQGGLANVPYLPISMAILKNLKGKSTECSGAVLNGRLNERIRRDRERESVRTDILEAATPPSTRFWINLGARLCPPSTVRGTLRKLTGVGNNSSVTNRYICTSFFILIPECVCVCVISQVS